MGKRELNREIQGKGMAFANSIVGIAIGCTIWALVQQGSASLVSAVCRAAPQQGARPQPGLIRRGGAERALDKGKLLRPAVLEVKAARHNAVLGYRIGYYHQCAGIVLKRIAVKETRVKALQDGRRVYMRG